MNDACLAFLQEITALSPCLSARYQETLEYWTPEPPPLTIIFGDIGCEVAKNLGKFDQKTKSNIFASIEVGMTSSDEQLRTAVTTGLVEAMIAHSSKRNRGWEEIRPLLGGRSRAHADWWMSET